MVCGLKPVFNEQSKVLILGSFPSVMSRSTFYYGNPRNRFWQTLETLLGDPVPSKIEDRVIWLLNHRIALWDIVGECEIKGSSDASIKVSKINDIGALVRQTKIAVVFCNGTKSYALCNKYFAELRPILLPSTSPANVRFDFASWQGVADALKASNA